MWSDGTETDVSGEITYSQEALTTADTEVQLQYTSGGVTVSAAQSITVKAAADDETETNDPADTDGEAEQIILQTRMTEAEQMIRRIPTMEVGQII